MRKAIIFLFVFILLLVTPTALRYFSFYGLGAPDRVEPSPYDPSNIPPVPTPTSGEHVDDPEVGQGFILIDKAHGNSFTMEEIGYLDGRLAARGFELVPFNNGDLAMALRPAEAFIVIAPLDTFSIDEIQAVADFVDRGGRLLLVGDPTRFNLVIEEDLLDFSYTVETDEIPLNSLANEFDIIFNGDYLYNTAENEGNFRNIIVTREEFSEDALVADLQRLAFYGTHSLRVGPGGTPLIRSDANTWSSATDRPGDLTLVASTHAGRVLALGDVQFLTEPYYTVYDNSQFIANIADFLVGPADREFVLADFPYFFGDSVDLIYTGLPELGPNAFDEIIALQRAFRQIDKTLHLTAEAERGHDTLYLGLYNQSQDVAEIIASSGISLTIRPPIVAEPDLEQATDTKDAGAETGEPSSDEAGEEEIAEEAAEAEETIRLIESGLGKVQMSGTALILLNEGDGRRTVVVLAASNDGLASTVERLLDMIPADSESVLADCLLQLNLALCPTGVADEAVEAELDTGGAPEAPEPAAPVDEDDDVDDGDENGARTDELDAVNQGAISLDETVQGELAEGESHTWSFSDGPAVVDIVLSSEELDTVLELYDADNELMELADDGFSGEDEVLTGIEIPDDDTYSILVRDYFGSSGAYTLTVTAAEEASREGGSIFVFGDDDGVALTSGFTSVDRLAVLMEEEYTVTTWVSSQDGPLEGIALDTYELVIWDSGDYRDEEGFWGDDTAAIIDYVDNGGQILIIGASPTILGGAELARLTDLEIFGDDPVILDGLEPGDIIDLDQAYDTVSSQPFDDDLDQDSIAFLLRGPDSAESGQIVGIATTEPEADQKTAILIFPFSALPPDIQEILLANLLNWFDLSPS